MLNIFIIFNKFKKPFFFIIYNIFNFRLEKSKNIRGPDKIICRAGFGPWAVVWTPLF